MLAIDVKGITGEVDLESMDRLTKKLEWTCCLNTSESLGEYLAHNILKNRALGNHVMLELPEENSPEYPIFIHMLKSARDELAKS